MSNAVKTDTPKKEEVIKHIENDIAFPATKDEMVEACDEMSDVPRADKQWFIESLPPGLYENAGEVKQALNLA